MKKHEKLTLLELNNLILSEGFVPIKNVKGINENGAIWLINKSALCLHILGQDKKTGKTKVFMTSFESKADKDTHVRCFIEGTRLLHRVMAATFMDVPYEENVCIHHRDLNKKNNSLENLQLMSRSDHMTLHWKLRRSAKKEVKNYGQ